MSALSVGNELNFISTHYLLAIIFFNIFFFIL